MMTRRADARPLIVATALAACILAAGCSSSGGAPASQTVGSSTGSTASTTPAAASSSAKPAAATTIAIKDFGYAVSGPVAAGSTVDVTNGDAQAHTVTADSGNAFDVTVEPGKTATFTAPSAAGTYKFHCTFHSTMHGTLTVTK